MFRHRAQYAEHGGKIVMKGFTGKEDIVITQSRERTRTDEIDSIIGSNDKLRAQTGWSPRIPIDRMLRDLYDDALAKLSGN